MPDIEPDESWEQVGVVLVDFAKRKVRFEFDEDFYKRPLEEQASIASALLEAALNEHVDAQDARVDALTPAPVADWDKPVSADEAVS